MNEFNYSSSSSVFSVNYNQCSVLSIGARLNPVKKPDLNFKAGIESITHDS